MITSNWQGCTSPTPRPSRRYERLIGSLLSSDLVDVRRCEQLAIYRTVERLRGRFCGRCNAMSLAAEKFSCSYEKVRQAVYAVEKQQNNKEMNRTIKIKNEAGYTTIDIEGTIGLSEAWQFDNPESRVATYERFKECVSEIADIRNSHIRVNIRSTGGDVNDAILIYEALRATGAHVTTCCYGYTASAATIVAQAASDGARLIAPTSLYLIHNSLCSTEGNAAELEAEVEMLRQTDRRIAEIYASRSGRKVEEVAELMAENGGRGRWLSPKEAIEAGLVDAVEEVAPTAVAEPSLKERAKRGVKAFLKALGIEEEEALPAEADDVNYIPREEMRAKVTLAQDVVEVKGVSIEFEEGQLAASPTVLKAVEDPNILESALDPRSKAYEHDARSMRTRTL